MHVSGVEVEDIVLVASIVEVSRLDLEYKLLDEGTAVDGLRVGVGVPCLLFHLEGRLGQDRPEPA